jgi:hypothetical protein
VKVLLLRIAATLEPETPIAAPVTGTLAA